MPEAVIYTYSHRIHTTYFSRPHAKLPVKLTNGEVKLVGWGCREQENSEMPWGGWARLASIQEGKWSLYSPKPVMLPINKFMKTDFEGHVHWYDIPKGQFIQGLLAKNEEEYRVYIVTIVPESFHISHDRWPRIVANLHRSHSI